MRILHIYNLNRVAQLYCDALEQMGHTVKIFQPSLLGAHLPLSGKLALMPLRLFNLRHITGILRPEHFDLAHIHWASYGLLGLIGRVPYVVHCHGSDVRYRLQHPVYRKILTPILQNASAVACITPELLDAVRPIRSDSIFFPGPIDTRQFAPVEEETKDEERPWTVLLFTRLDPIKGPEMAMQGIERFARRHKEVRVKVLDWGLLRDHYKKLYGERFEFLPTFAPEKTQQLIQSADVVVGQCRLGILSLCELQAMSCAKPLITSFRYPEAYPTAPPLYHISSSEEIDAQLEALYRDPRRGRELGKEARQWIIDHHDRRLLATRLEVLYQAITLS